MGNTHACRKIVSKLTTFQYKYTLNSKYLNGFRSVNQQPLIHLYLLEDFIVNKMPPKRGRPAKEANTKQKATNIDEEEEGVAVVEKKLTTKRGRKSASKSPPNYDKAEATVDVDDVDDDDDDDDDDEEVEAAKTKGEKKVNVKKPTRGVAKKREATPVSEEEIPKVQKKSGRKQRAPTKRKIVEKIEEDEDDESESEPDFEPEPESKRQRKITSGKQKNAANDKVEQNVATKSSENKKNKDDNGNGEEPPAKKAKTETKMINASDTDLEAINYNCDKLNSKGEKYNLKICSWNVSGVRAIIKKNGMDYFVRENADIFVLQETKCDMKKLPDEIKIPGYKHYYLDSDKSGYCGVALYCKSDNEPIEIKYGLNNAEMDKEGRLITAEYDNFYLINVYVPNAGQKLVSMPKRLKWNELFKNYVKELDAKKPVIICGDMNVAHQEIDLANPKSNMKNAGFTKEERDGMTEFLAEGFIDTFRQLYPDKTGAYTFWSYFANSRSKNIGWRLDYYIVSESIKDNICDNIMRSSVYGSDHCPIVLYANL